MRSKEGGVMSLEEKEAARTAGADIPGTQYTEGTIETSHGPIRVVQQVEESDEGTYNPETKKFIPFHREAQEQERKAA